MGPEFDSMPLLMPAVNLEALVKSSHVRFLVCERKGGKCGENPKTTCRFQTGRFQALFFSFHSTQNI